MRKPPVQRLSTVNGSSSGLQVRIGQVPTEVARESPISAVGTGSCSPSSGRFTRSRDWWVSDLSETQVAKARERLPKADLRTADLTRPFELDDATVDVAYAGEVIEHLASPDDFLDELHRVVRPGGLLLLTTPNLLSWFNRGFAVAGLGPVYVEYSTRDSSLGMGPLRRLKAGSAPVGHVHVLTARALRDLLAAAGFDIISMRAPASKRRRAPSGPSTRRSAASRRHSRESSSAQRGAGDDSFRNSSACARSRRCLGQCSGMPVRP